MRKKAKKVDESARLRLKENAPSMEAYRILRTNIEFSRTIKPIKRILITSSVLGEGKSTTAASLAKIFASGGTKTLIVDLDLRRPVQHRILSVENSGGVMELLAGSISIDEAIKPTDTENLFLLNCGIKPPNPADMLSSGALEKALEVFDEMFDIIILDSPPVAALADAAIISRFADTTILVVSAGKVEFQDLDASLYNLKNSGASILGIVMNNITKASRGYKYYNYYNYY